MSDCNEREEPLREPAEFPSSHTQLALRGPAGTIEAMADVPEDGDAGFTAIILSPTPAVGTMHSKVVHIIERSFRELGAATVRFNYRGVGASGGEHDNGVAEAEDLLAVANWIELTRPGTQLWLGGYGMGGYVAVRGCQKLPVTQLVTVAPPVDQFDFAALPTPTCPWLVVQGDTDEAINPDAVYAWIDDLEPPPQLVRMEDADHGFHRRLMDLRGAIKNGIRRQLRNVEQDEQ